MNASEARWVRMSAWCVLAFLVVFGVGWGVLGRNIPPYPASFSAEHIAHIFREHKDTFRIGYALGAFGTTFYVPWVVGLFVLMRRMEQGGHVLSYVQLAGGLLTVPVPMLACIVWLTASLRPETDPANVRLLVDLGWMIMDIGFGVTILQYVALGIVVLADKRPTPLFPKWVAWLGIWLGLEFVVELVMPYFRSGPFSWSGMFDYWLPFFGPFFWMTAVMIYTLKATRRLEAEWSPREASPAPVLVTS